MIHNIWHVCSIWFQPWQIWFLVIWEQIARVYYLLCTWNCFVCYFNATSIITIANRASQFNCAVVLWVSGLIFRVYRPSNYFCDKVAKRPGAIYHVHSYAILRQTQTSPILLQVSSLDVCFYTLNPKCSHFDDLIVTGCTGSWQNDNLLCSQRREDCQHDSLLASV